MIRTIIGIVLLLCAVLWLPVWLQLLLFAIAVVVIPYRAYILLSAIVSDALYAPTSHFSLTAHWMTLIVLAMIGLYWFIMRKLRVTPFYGLEA
jgi:hypothetical protein